MQPGRPSRILIADVPEMEEAIRLCFPTHAVRYASTWNGAVAALQQQQFDAAVIDILFSGARMFDLVRVIRADRRHDAMAVICVRGSRAAFPQSLAEGIREAVVALRADGFIDFQHDEQGLAYLCEETEKLLARSRAASR